MRIIDRTTELLYTAALSTPVRIGSAALLAGGIIFYSHEAGVNFGQVLAYSAAGQSAEAANAAGACAADVFVAMTCSAGIGAVVAE